MTPQELFAKIDDQLTAHPATHNQERWFNATECGTTRCVAGWAVQLSKEDPNESDWCFKIRYLLDHGTGGSSYFAVARHLLGLGDDEAERLFFASTEVEAATFVRSRAGRG